MGVEPTGGRVEAPGIQIHYPRSYDHSVEIEAETSQRLWEAISAVYNNDAVPGLLYSLAAGQGRPRVPGRLQPGSRAGRGTADLGGVPRGAGKLAGTVLP